MHFDVCVVCAWDFHIAKLSSAARASSRCEEGGAGEREPWFGVNVVAAAAARKRFCRRQVVKQPADCEVGEAEPAIAGGGVPRYFSSGLE